MKLIYCAGRNKKLSSIAREAGFLLGARLPGKSYFPIYFADQDWKNPDREKYMAGLKECRPVMATVLDLEHEDQFTEVMDWAEEAAQYVDRIVIIPKIPFNNIPTGVNGKQVVLGYSVPSRYGKTTLPLSVFAGWPVHLLGGSPHLQIKYWTDFQGIADVVSLDGNMMNLMATRRCQFWVPGTAKGARNRYWPTLDEADGYRWGKGAYIEAFRRSCENIQAEWRDILE